MHINILTKFKKKCSKFHNDLIIIVICQKFHDLRKIHNFCPLENVKCILINKVSMFLVTEEDYLSDKVSENLFSQKFYNDWIIPVTRESFNLSRKYISYI